MSFKTFKMGENGEKIPLTEKELDEMYKEVMTRAEQQTTHRRAEQQTHLGEIRGETAVVQRAWQERARLLAQKRQSQDESFAGAIEVQNLAIFTFIKNPEVFKEWMQILCQGYESLVEQISKGEADPDSYATRDIMRAFGYCVRLAENLGVSRLATDKESNAIQASFVKEGKPPFGMRVITYRSRHAVRTNEYFVPVNPEDQTHKNIFYRLEQLRRAHRNAWLAIKEAREDDKDSAETTLSVETSKD